MGLAAKPEWISIRPSRQEGADRGLVMISSCFLEEAAGVSKQSHPRTMPVCEMLYALVF